MSLQRVRVAFPTGATLYTYGWYTGWELKPLEVGDIVEVPPNVAFPEGGRTGTVVALGSDYKGQIALIVRKVEQ